MSVSTDVILFLATGGGVGRLPRAPGTFGSLLGLPLAFGINRLDWFWGVAVVCIFILFATVIAHLAEAILGRQDPGSVVIDEVAGMLLTLIGLELNLLTIILGFTLFRVLDIFKPFPIGWLDQKLDGGVGIVADDLVAGVMSNVCLHLIMFGLSG